MAGARQPAADGTWNGTRFELILNWQLETGY